MAVKTAVAGELYESITGQLFEIGRQLRQSDGYPYDPYQLKRHLQAAIEGRFSVPSATFRFDKRQDGWELVSNKTRRVNESSKLEFISFLRPGEESVSSATMQRRAREMVADLSQEDAEFLLDHRELLPQLPERAYYIPFTGTVWRYPHGGLFVPYLDWDDGRWDLDWRWLGFDWDSRGTFVRPRNY